MRPRSRNVCVSESPPTMIADKNGAAGKSESMTAGFVVAPRVRMIIDLQYGGTLIDIIIRGYLTE